MSEYVIGKRYAKALLNLTQEANSVEKTGSELKDIADLYGVSEALRRVMMDPKVPQNQKTSIVSEVATKIKASDLTRKFCCLIATKGRFSIIREISFMYNEISNRLLGKAVAEITIAHPLDTQQEKALQEELASYTGKKIELKTNVDPSILGGMVAQVGSIVLDGSVLNQLNLIRETVLRR